MDSLTKKTLKTSRGLCYVYYVSAAASGKPTLLLLHGFPDQAEMWVDLATKHLVPAGYGVVIPDCLGYGGTDKPTDPKQYVFSKMTQDLCEILDAEKIDKVVSTGHDWGSVFAQRFYVFHPERCPGLITLNVPYQGQAPGPMDLDAMQAVIENAVGYFPLWYWYLFSDPLEGPKILDAHLSSFYDAAHPADPDDWLQTLCAKDGIKNWCLQDKHCPVQEYAKGAAKDKFVARFTRDGFTAPLCWYRSYVENHAYEDEKGLPAERFVVNVPYLYIGALRDRICLPARINEPKQAGLLKQLTEEEIDAPHWCMLAKPMAVAEAVLQWLGRSYGAGPNL